jgi:glycosyltransferase involved in cell wall biosynthesis
MKKLNILFVSHYSGMYGANKSMFTLMLILKERYHVNPVVLLRHHGPICEYLENSGIKYHIFYFYWWINGDEGIFQYLLNWRKQVLNLLKINRLVRLFQVDKFDMVYSNSIAVNMGVYIARSLKTPHLWHIREGLELYGFKLSMGKFMARRFLKHGTDRYIVISEYMYGFYNDLIPQNLISTIYNGVSISKSERKSNILINDVLNLCIVGIISKQKNQMDALCAIKILVDKGYKNFKLHIVGTHTLDYAKTLEEYIESNGLNDFVVLCGHQDNVDEILQTMNVGLMTSQGEAFGRVTLEYMLHRMPVIASDSGANMEIVKNDINGSIYELFNSSDLASKIEYFINHPEQLDLIGGVAQEYAQTNFSSEQNAAKIFGVIQELCLN